MDRSNQTTYYNIPAPDRWYYQYNDLGDVLAWTDEDGVKLAAATPDFFGNYWTISGTIPEGNDHLGKTSKFIDSDIDLYYFNARWYDRERGRWMSEEPLGVDGPNMYHFNYNSPNVSLDPDGLSSWAGLKVYDVERVTITPELGVSVSALEFKYAPYRWKPDFFIIWGLIEWKRIWWKQKVYYDSY